MDPPEAPAQLERLATAIETSPHNLMSPRGIAELRSRHLPECIALARLLPAGRARLVDVGSGGGLPGLVIAIARPDLAVTLVESTRKKAAFLAATARELGLPVEVVADRVETLADRDAHRFDLATARAVAPLERLIPWVVPLLGPGGRLYAVKGASWADEVRTAAPALAAAGAEVIATPEDLDHERSPDTPRVVIIAPTARRSGKGRGR